MKRPPVKPAPAKPTGVPGIPEPLHIRPIPVDRLEFAPKNRDHDAAHRAKVADMARSLEAQGQLQPIGVCPSNRMGRFRIVFGATRAEAAPLAKMTTIEAKVYPALSEEQIRELQLIENEKRTDPSAVEQGITVVELLDLEARRQHGAASPEFNQVAASLKPKLMSAVARRLGVSEGWVRDRAYIARLTPEGRAALKSGRLPLAHARVIATVIDPAIQNEIIRAVQAEEHEGALPLTIEETRQLCGKHLFSLATVGWKLEVPFDGKPACVGCPHNTATNPGLFGEGKYTVAPNAAVPYGAQKEPEQGICTRESCYRAKLAASTKAIRSVASKAVKLAGDEELKPAERKQEARAAVSAAPVYVKPTAVDRKFDELLAKAKQADAAEAAHGGAAAAKTSVNAQENARRNKAQQQLEVALRNRICVINEAIAARATDVSGRLAALALFAFSDLLPATRSGKKMKQAQQSPGLAAAISAVVAPSFDRICELERGLKGPWFVVFDDWADRHNTVPEQLAKALGIEAPPMPTLEQFLDEQDRPAEKKKAEDKEAERKAADEAGERFAEEDEAAERGDA